MSRGRIGILTVIKPELDAMKAVLTALGSPPERLQRKWPDVYHQATLRSELMNDDVEIILSCIATAGNPDSSAAATSLISRFDLDLIVLVGIAAGLFGKTKIGEVVVSDRVVGYEGAALVLTDGGETVEEPRPAMTDLMVSLMQDLANYDFDGPSLKETLLASGGALPRLKPESELAEDEVECEPMMRLQTVASGEKLLRDPRFLWSLKRGVHGRIEVGEMEAAGVAAAAKRSSTPWIVFRGISDFGDPRKSDSFHDYAARMASLFAVDFIRSGVEFLESPANDGNSTLAAQLAPNRSFQDRQFEDLSDAFEPESRSLLQETLGTRTPLVAFLSVSPSRQVNEIADRYHLGHAFFAETFLRVCKAHPTPGVLITPSIVYADWRQPAFNRMMHEVAGSWLSALEDRVLPQVITESIFSESISDEPFSEAMSWLSATGPSQRYLSDVQLDHLDGWRFGVMPPMAVIDQLRASLNAPSPERLSNEQVLSLAYALGTAPSWYSSEWMVRTVKFLCRVDEGALARRVFDSEGLTIVESSKNRVVWESLEAVASLFRIDNFPRMLWTRTVPNTRLDAPMRSRDPNGCIFLSKSGTAFALTANAPFISLVCEMTPGLETVGEIAEDRSRLAAFAATWKTKLQQGDGR